MKFDKKKYGLDLGQRFLHARRFQHQALIASQMTGQDLERQFRRDPGRKAFLWRSVPWIQMNLGGIPRSRLGRKLGIPAALRRDQ